MLTYRKNWRSFFASMHRKCRMAQAAPMPKNPSHGKQRKVRVRAFLKITRERYRDSMRESKLPNPRSHKNNGETGRPQEELKGSVPAEEDSAKKENEQANGDTVEDVDCVKPLPIFLAGPVTDNRVGVLREVQAISEDPDLCDPPQLLSESGSEISKIFDLASACNDEHPA